MTGYLYRVFACIGVGSTEDGHQYLIDKLLVVAYDMSEEGAPGLAFSEWSVACRVEYTFGSSYRLGTADTDNANGSSGSGSDGADGIGIVHNGVLVIAYIVIRMTKVQKNVRI